jgi:hypothetical protein
MGVLGLGHRLGTIFFELTAYEIMTIEHMEVAGVHRVDAAYGVGPATLVCKLLTCPIGIKRGRGRHPSHLGSLLYLTHQGASLEFASCSVQYMLPPHNSPDFRKILHG